VVLDSSGHVVIEVPRLAIISSLLHSVRTGATPFLDGMMSTLRGNEYMATTKRDPLVEKLDNLLQEASMPEIIGALVKLCRKYKLILKRENNREYIGWEVIEYALKRAYLESGGDE
jgi:hypothetical protein